MLKLYGFSKVGAGARGHTRDLRVLWALEELGMPYEIMGMDYPAHDLNTDAYRKLSPFEQIPAIDDDGVVLSESAAIVLYLARKAGKLIPKDPAGQAQVERWCFVALNTMEMPLMSLLILGWMGEKDNAPKLGGFLEGWIHKRMKQLDNWLEGREYIATTEFTVADLLVAHVLRSGVKDPAFVDPYPNVVAYRDRCLARPAWKRAYDAYDARVVQS